MELDWSEDVKINKYDLDTECVELPSVLNKWATLESNLIKQEDLVSHQVDIMHDTLKRIKAEASIEIRGKPLQWIRDNIGVQVNKVTNDVYKDLTELHPKVIKYQQMLWDKKKEYLVIKGKRNDMKTARRMIESKANQIDHLIYMINREYYLKDSYPKAVKEKEHSVKRIKAAKILTSN
jgi:hypothetical protein